jgi:hypothetical protein
MVHRVIDRTADRWGDDQAVEASSTMERTAEDERVVKSPFLGR